MEIHTIDEKVFSRYGKKLAGYDPSVLFDAMRSIDMPCGGVSYEPNIDKLAACDIAKELSCRGFGGMPIQIGMCWGYNTKLNCLEYHRNSEINIAADDVVLLLAKQEDILQGALDTSKVMGFCVPAGTVVELYATTLHYAPCRTNAASGFRVAVVLPRGTNTDKPAFTAITEEDRWMVARNKWVLSHALSDEAAHGAYIGLTGQNIDITL